MNHSVGVIIHILIHLIMMLEMKWQNENFTVSVPYLCSLLSCLEQYYEDTRMFWSWAGGLAVLFSFFPL